MFQLISFLYYYLRVLFIVSVTRSEEYTDEDVCELKSLTSDITRGPSSPGGLETMDENSVVEIIKPVDARQYLSI